MAQVIFRVGKLKSLGDVAAAAGHNARLRTTPNADPNGKFYELIDRNGESVLDRVKEIHDDIRDLCKQNKWHMRPDAVAASEVIISASPEYFRPDDPAKAGHYDQARLDKWLEAVIPWAKKEIGSQSEIVSMAVHLDEATPHIQMIVVPKNHRGELSHRAVFGGDIKGEKLSQWQDLAAEPVKHLGIERGLKNSKATHRKIKDFYGAVNQPEPVIPPITAKKPAPLAPPTAAEKKLLGGVTSERAQLEQQHADKMAKYKEQKNAYGNAAINAHPVLAQQAKAAKSAERDKKQAEFRAAAAEKALEKSKEEANLVRNLPLDEVLTKTYGATEAADSKPHHSARKFDLPDGREIVCTDEKWVEQSTKIGGKGAINLVMHLEGYQQTDFKKAVRLLLDDFDQATMVPALTRHNAETNIRRIEQIASDPVPAPTPHAPAWQKVRQWLMEVRGLPEKLIDRAHEIGKVYADRMHNAVFPRQKGGAFVRGTQEQRFVRTVGSAECGAYVLPGQENGQEKSECWICESAIDALSIKAMHPQVHVIATGGNLLKPQQIRDMIPAGTTRVVLAYDDDDGGGKLADRMKMVLIARNDVERVKPPKGKDWNDTIRADPDQIGHHWKPTPAPDPTPQPAPAPAAPSTLPRPS